MLGQYLIMCIKNITHVHLHSEFNVGFVHSSEHISDVPQAHMPPPSEGKSHMESYKRIVSGRLRVEDGWRRVKKKKAPVEIL